MAAMILIWGGLALCWVGALVFGWGNQESGTAGQLLHLDSANDLIPDASINLASSHYLDSGFLLALVAVTAASVLLPLITTRARTVAGIVMIAGAAVMAYFSYAGSVPDWPQPAVYIAAAVIATCGICLIGRWGSPMGALAGVLALAAAAWNTNAVVDLLIPYGRPGLGAIALTLGYLLVAGGAFSFVRRRRLPRP